MGYETAKFGDGGYTSGTSNVVSDVSQHYGPFTGEGEQGVNRTDGAYCEAVVDFNNTGPLHNTQVLGHNSYVVDIIPMGLTGAIATATVGATDISGAGGTSGGTTDPLVVGPVSGELVVTGPTAGTVVILYYHQSGA